MASTLYESVMTRVGPPWLRRVVGVKLLGSIGEVVDTHVDRIASGVRRRFPGFDSDDSLAQIGRERRIRRGHLESGATYARRLRGWWDAHRARGGPYALLAQLYAFFLDVYDPRIDVVYQSGTRRWIDAGGGGVVTRDAVTWTGDGSGRWAQTFFVFICLADGIENFLVDEAGRFLVDEAGRFLVAPLMSGGTVDDEDAEVFRCIPREWSAAHIAYVTIILLYGVARCWNYPQPVPTWTDWGASTTWGGPQPVTLIAE